MEQFLRASTFGRRMWTKDLRGSRYRVYSLFIFNSPAPDLQECYICFYILHGTNHQLPKLACRTCKKKFHSACLYKWFSTSNNSSCPLCRNLF